MDLLDKLLPQVFNIYEKSKLSLELLLFLFRPLLNNIGAKYRHQKPLIFPSHNLKWLRIRYLS